MLNCCVTETKEAPLASKIAGFAASFPDSSRAYYRGIGEFSNPPVPKAPINFFSKL